MAVTTNEKDKNFEDYFYNKNYLKIGSLDLLLWVPLTEEQSWCITSVHTNKVKIYFIPHKIVVGN